ncbi:MAG TPA: DUF2807 domain-containing protein [Spirochaetota bacterium]|nr:DUF2807 domain-containing protein [Spirochaetota bacterium]
MRKYIIGIIFIVLFMSSCENNRYKSGNIVTVQRSFNGYNGVSLEGKGIIYLKQCDQFVFKAKAPEYVLDIIDVTVRKGVLTISYLENLSSDFIPEYTIELPQLSYLGVEGAAIVKMENTFTGNQITIESKGATAAEVYVDVNNLTIKAGGNSVVVLNGEASILEAEIKGKTELRARDFIAEKAVIKSTGFTKSEIGVKEFLDVTISGHGNVKYNGTPKISTSIAGAGRIESGNYEPARDQKQAATAEE